MKQLQWDRKFITKVRAGLSVTALMARKRESLNRKAEEEKLCAYTCSSKKMWTRIIQANAENVNNYSRAHSLHPTFPKNFTRSKFCKFA